MLENAVVLRRNSWLSVLVLRKQISVNWKMEMPILR